MRSFVLRVQSRDWRSFVKQSFHIELRNGLQEMIAFVERQRLAIGEFAHLRYPTDQKNTLPNCQKN